MKGKLILEFILLLNLQVYCQKTELSQKINESALLIDKLSIPAMILVWYDKYYDEHSIKPCGTANSKKFGLTRKLIVDKPKLFVLPIMDQIPFLISPMDTVLFYTTSRQSIFRENETPTLRHKSDIKRTNEIKFFETVFDSIGACYGLNSYYSPGNIKNIREVLAYHSSILQKRLQFLERRKESSSIGDDFYLFAKSYFNFKFYDDVIKSFASKKVPDSLTRSIAFKIADSLVINLNAANGVNYYSWYDAIKNYVELKTIVPTTSIDDFERIVDDISEKLNGTARNFAVFYLYKTFLDKSPQIIGRTLDLLHKYCKDEEYISYILSHSSFTKRNINVKMDERLIGFNGETRKLTDVINEIKGKVIFVDFWASWCMPCLAEFPFSKKLIEDFKDKGVVFLFLSIDTYADRWKKEIQQNQMQGHGVHFLILDIENNYFIRKYNIGPIPRYILINEKGEVVNADAPRPSEEKTKKLILDLLEKE